MGTHRVGGRERKEQGLGQGQGQGEVESQLDRRASASPINSTQSGAQRDVAALL